MKFGRNFFFITLVSISCLLMAQNQPQSSGDWGAVEKALGRSGQAQPDGAMKFGMPRKDLKVTVDGLEVKPGLALGSWVAFSRPQGDSMLMGDLVLTEDEVTPVMAKLESSGIQITALHNHILHESPRIMYMHIGAHGDPVKLAEAVHDAVSLTKTPGPDSGPAPAAPQDIGIDTSQIEQALGHKGKVNGGIFQVGVPRAEQITHSGMAVPPSMGLATALNFQPTGNGKAAITGDFVLLRS